MAHTKQLLVRLIRPSQDDWRPVNAYLSYNYYTCIYIYLVFLSVIIQQCRRRPTSGHYNTLTPSSAPIFQPLVYPHAYVHIYIYIYRIIIYNIVSSIFTRYIVFPGKLCTANNHVHAAAYRYNVIPIVLRAHLHSLHYTDPRADV